MRSRSLSELASTRWSDVGFVMLDASGARLGHTLAECKLQTDSATRGAAAYELLERRGIFVISPWRPSATGVTLSGGSYSRVTLDVSDGRATIHKLLRAGRCEGLDREIRQRGESAWLRQLPADAAALFAPLVETIEDGPELATVTDFVPGYTLAERVFQRRLDGASLARDLIDVYQDVRERLWRHPPSPLPMRAVEESYPQRIARRIGTILASSYPADGVVRRLLQADTAIVNGRRCSGVSSLLQRLHRGRHWAPLVHPRGQTLCHGDLILEDVIVSADAPLGFVLVDPNPANRHPVFDVCKTMMSLWLGYEAIYFDRFAITELDPGSGAIELSLTLADEDVEHVYATAAALFLDFVDRELGDSLRLPSPARRGLLRMGAAINMLAIAVFHLLHHGREERALAFVATALWHAQDVLEG